MEHKREEAHRAMEHKRELDKAEAEVKRLADKAEIYHYMAQVAGTHDYERLWRNLQETVKTAAAGGGMGKGKGED
jgi:plasmid stabilization system protein ParE